MGGASIVPKEMVDEVAGKILRTDRYDSEQRRVLISSLPNDYLKRDCIVAIAAKDAEKGLKALRVAKLTDETLKRDCIVAIAKTVSGSPIPPRGTISEQMRDCIVAIAAKDAEHGLKALSAVNLTDETLKRDCIVAIATNDAEQGLKALRVANLTNETLKRDCIVAIAAKDAEHGLTALLKARLTDETLKRDCIVAIAAKDGRSGLDALSEANLTDETLKLDCMRAIAETLSGSQITPQGTISEQMRDCIVAIAAKDAWRGLKALSEANLTNETLKRDCIVAIAAKDAWAGLGALRESNLKDERLLGSCVIAIMKANAVSVLLTLETLGDKTLQSPEMVEAIGQGFIELLTEGNFTDAERLKRAGKLSEDTLKTESIQQLALSALESSLINNRWDSTRYLLDILKLQEVRNREPITRYVNNTFTAILQSKDYSALFKFLDSELSKYLPRGGLLHLRVNQKGDSFN
jgi:hypothetical protein